MGNCHKISTGLGSSFIEPLPKIFGVIGIYGAMGKSLLAIVAAALVISTLIGARLIWMNGA